MKLKMLAAATAAFALSLAPQASASIITWTVTGDVREGLDGGDVFGGGDLTGHTFNLVFTWDTTKGSLLSTPAGGPPNALIGIPGHESPGSATLTINGASHLFVGDSVASLSAEQPSASSALRKFQIDGDFERYDGVFAGWNMLLTPDYYSALDFPYEAACSQPIQCVGDAQIQLFDVANNTTVWLTSLRFDIDRISITSTDPEYPSNTPLPEPATWALLMLGFFAIGGVVRGRRITARRTASVG